MAVGDGWTYSDGGAAAAAGDQVREEMADLARHAAMVFLVAVDLPAGVGRSRFVLSLPQALAPGATELAETFLRDVIERANHALEGLDG